MTKNPKLSIIMPVYNAEKYVEKALNSFVNELKPNDEVIIVDDCSTDNSCSILKNYIKKNKDKKIILLQNSKNLGAGLSKDKALKTASGEYIGFIDSDDYVDKNYFYNMLEMAQKDKSDIVVSDIALVEKNKTIKNSIFENNVYSTDATSDFKKEILFGHWACVSTCTKLFKKSLISNLTFSKKKSDDILFTIYAIVAAKKISYCKGNTYYYFQSENSLTRNSSYEKYEDGLTCLCEAIDYLYRENIEYAKIYSANALLPHICYSLDSISVNDLDKFLKIVKRSFDDSLKNENLIANNQYLKNNALYRSKIYRDYLRKLSKQNYENIIFQIKKRENIDRKIKSNKPKTIEFNPLISIIIPVYNGENYLESAIKSAIAQTYKNIEIIVIDDGSTDNTEKIALKYKDKIKYFKKENGGVATALNLALKKMKGDYFSWLSHDDLYYEDKIARQVEFLNCQEEKNIVLFSDYILMNENERILGDPVIINHKMTIKKPEYCLLRGCINGITMLIPKVAFDTCGNFNTELRCTQDYELWHRMSKKFKFVHIPEILAKTRIHSLQDTNQNPRVISEGEILWTNMIEDVVDKRKKELEGSIYNYYYKMALHLKNSPYINTLNMCIKQCKNLNLKKYNRRPIDNTKEKSIFEKVLYCIDNYGVLHTFEIIIKKILKR